MGAVSDIKERVEKLTPEEQTELLAWLIELDHQQWDAEIAHDLAAGQLDDLTPRRRRISSPEKPE